MLEIKESIAQGFGKGELYPILKQLQNMGIAVGGEVFFVDCNFGSDTALAGNSWDFPFKTLAYAIGVSNTSIARGAAGWASRNTILLKGDSCKEDLTVLPAKCDVVGVGSNDAFNKTEIKGFHIETQSGTIMSTGFYNLQFVNDSAEAIFAVTACCGLYFGDCDFIAEADSIHAIHIIGDTGHDLRILNCRIINDEYNDKFATAGILVATTTTFWNLVIENSYVEGEIGIQIDTTNLYNGLINNNTVKAAASTITDTSNDCVVSRNRCITAGTNAASTGIDINALLASDNRVTGSEGTSIYVPVAKNAFT